jgi:hypothetical protein
MRGIAKILLIRASTAITFELRCSVVFEDIEELEDQAENRLLAKVYF